MFKQLVLSVIALPNRLVNAVILRYRRVEVGQGVRINGRIHIFGQGLIAIKDNVRINSSRSSNPIGGDRETVLFTGTNGRISIGKGTGLSNASIVSYESVSIGENCKIGGSVHIYDTDFHSIDYAKRNNGDVGAKSSPIVIGDNVFIGAHSIILKGVHIGFGAVIGAGSIVTKNVPELEVWAGNPAKRVKGVDHCAKE